MTYPDIKISGAGTDVVNVYQIADNGWYRIGIDRWISGSPLYTERIEIEPPQPPLTLEERVAQNEADIKRLKDEVFG